MDLDLGEDASETEEGSETPPEEKGRLRRGEVLNRDELWPFRKSFSTTTISLVRDVKSGKSTLISALYASFCKGPLAEYSFKSSYTLTAFARLHHSALVRSERDIPTTPRTSRQDVGFFHLNVVGPGGEQHIMIADRSGEDFREARRNTDLIPNLWELQMADRVCFILDAGRMVNPETRTGYKREFKQQIWALLNNNAVAPGSTLEILSTKLDQLAPAGHSIPDLDELGEFERAVVSEFGQAGHRVDVRRICALPRSNYAVGILGLEDLLRGWSHEKPAGVALPLPAVAPARWIDQMMSPHRLCADRVG
ncbi:hypothetical protein GTW51_17995 [Aurantimonas aggregata]|uniref:Double-GTPase 2 domain-containing protein n=1 Tax=Aurantimonas aggregata TaxID=2047720 RepID=A0A6L9ML78_9HYPH|nr:hypothetical protein [Aurantimonas aggregata]NDV88597.1 hypothetical protein [Aurantimonas aggregata]